MVTPLSGPSWLGISKPSHGNCRSAYRSRGLPRRWWFRLLLWCWGSKIALLVSMLRRVYLVVAGLVNAIVTGILCLTVSY
jgi:hypothetical protein